MREKAPFPIYDVVGIGQAFTDSIAHVSHDFLREHSVPVDGGIAVSEKNFAAIRKDAGSFELIPGGAVANTITGLAALGLQVGFWGKVANDHEGKAFVQALHEREIALFCENTCPHTNMSANCLVLTTSDGTRSFVVNHGCSLAFTDEDFASFDFSQTKFLLIEAKVFMNTSIVPLIKSTLRRAKRDKSKIVVSLTNVSSWKEGFAPDAAQSLSEVADIVVGNNVEVDAFQKTIPSAISDECLVLTTKGEEGAFVKQGGYTLHVKAAKPRHFVNSLGAGDQFLAGFLGGLSRGYDIEKSALLAVSCATLILEAVGARPAINCSWSSLWDEHRPKID